MALPASRVIGHKEYAAGRKSDPTYSMDWRRQRVAAFTPRNAPTPEDDIVDDATMDKIADKVVAKLLRSDVKPDAGTQSFTNVLSQIHTALTDEVPLTDSDVQGGPEDGEGKPISRMRKIDHMEARSRRQARDMATLLDRLPAPPA
jgi:hypothetical protein